MRLPARQSSEGPLRGAGERTSTLRPGTWSGSSTRAAGLGLHAALLRRADERPAQRRRALALLEAWARQADASISLAVRAPLCPMHCLFCDRDILAAPSSEAVDDYVDTLVAEVLTLRRLIGGDRDVLQLHLGGGAACEWRAPQLTRFMTTLRRAWRVPAEAELSADCDPRRIGSMRLRLLRHLGFDEIRFGVPDLDPRVQQAIGKLQSPALVEDACELARASQIGCVTLRLMIGLPYQDETSWRATLARTVAMAPDRITLGRYRHRPWHAPAQGATDPDTVPDEAACHGLSVLAAAMLREAGYRWIGADQFVLDSDALALAADQRRLRRSPIGHTGAAEVALLGLGVAACSDLDGHRLVHEDTLAGWRDAVQAGQPPIVRVRSAGPVELQRHVAVQRLLCTLELPRELTEGGLEDGYDRLACFASTGDVEVLDDRIAVTDVGRHRLAALCAVLERVPAAPVGWS